MNTYPQGNKSSLLPLKAFKPGSSFQLCIIALFSVQLISYAVFKWVPNKFIEEFKFTPCYRK